jgi:hypothetical protein
MRPCALVLVLVFALGCEDRGSGMMTGEPDAAVASPFCQIESVVDRLIGGTQVMDCGNLMVQQADAPFVAARDCVLAADAGHSPYAARWEIQGRDSRVAAALVGIETAGGWTSMRLAYDGDPTGGGGEDHPVTSMWRCGSLTDLGSCSALHQNLCIQCAAETFVERCDSREM